MGPAVRDGPPYRLLRHRARRFRLDRQPFATDLLAAQPGAADLGQELVSLLIYRGPRLEPTKPWVAGQLV